MLETAPPQRFHLDGKTRMLLFTRGQTVVVWPQGGTGRALRGEGDVVVNVLAPLHQQLGVDSVRPLGGASEYLLADFPWLSTGMQSVSGDESSQTTETLQLTLVPSSFSTCLMPEWPIAARQTRGLKASAAPLDR